MVLGSGSSAVVHDIAATARFRIAQGPSAGQLAQGGGRRGSTAGHGGQLVPFLHAEIEDCIRLLVLRRYGLAIHAGKAGLTTNTGGRFSASCSASLSSERQGCLPCLLVRQVAHGDGRRHAAERPETIAWTKPAQMPSAFRKQRRVAPAGADLAPVVRRSAWACPSKYIMNGRARVRELCGLHPSSTACTATAASKDQQKIHPPRASPTPPPIPNNQPHRTNTTHNQK